MKKILSLLLALSLLLSCTALSGSTVGAAAEHTGSTFLIFGNTFSNLSLDKRIMTDNGDGTYSYPYHIRRDQVVSVFFKELKSNGSTRDYTHDFYYSSFDFTTNTEQDITIICNPDAFPYIAVEGVNIRPRYGDYFYAYCDFAGQQQFSREDGLMTENSDGTYSVTYRDVQPCDAVFDVNLLYSGESILGFYGYNVFPARITDVCDVTVYYQPDLSNGYTDHFSANCKIWAEGDYLVPHPDIVLENVRFNLGEQPCKKEAENVYSTVFQNVKTDKELYVWADFGTDLTYGEFYISWDEMVEISEKTETDAVLYPIYYSTNSITVHSPYQYTNLKMTLDATKLDYVAKEGAKFRFELIDMVKDVNMDGAYTISDATQLQRALAEYETLSDNQTIAADVNGDGKVNIDDVTALQRYLAES